MEIITQTYRDKISGVLGCFDRMVITGTLPQICYSQGMTSFLYSKGIRIFDYAKFVEPYKEQIRINAEQIAKENEVEIEFVRKSSIRKEDLVQKRMKERGIHTGLVHILSAMESCPSYKPWHDKSSGKTFLKGTQGKCLHYYFYFVDEYLGMIDNAFDSISDFERAQEISDNIDIKKIHKRLDKIAKKYCPVYSDFGQVYH